MTTYVLLFEPKKSAQKNGAVALATAVEAKNQKLAIMAATMQLEEEFPGASDNFFNPKVTEDVIGSPRPAVGVFDERFPAENELVDGEWRRIEKQDDGSDESVDFSELSLREKIAAIALYGQTSISGHEFSMVCDYLDLPAEDADADKDKLIRVLSNIEALEPVNDDLLLSVVNGVNAQFPSIANTSIMAINAFVEKQISAAGSEKTEPQQEIKGLELKRQYPHTYATLDKEIAAALVCDPEDCWELTTEQVRASSVLMNNEDEAFKRWSMELRTSPEALKIPRPIIFALIKAGKKRPELVKDSNARHQFVVDFLSKHMPYHAEPEVKNLGGGHFSIDGLMADTASNQGEKTEVTTVTERGGSSIPSGESATENAPAATKEPETASPTKKEPIADDASNPENEDRTIKASTCNAIAEPESNFQQRAAAVDAEIEKKPAEAQENLKIWKSVQRTDPRYTKALAGAGFDGTSINSEYMIMRATELFGPIGTGWGYSVLEEKMIAGAPMAEPVYDDNKKFIGSRMLRDADGSLICEQNHSVKISLWYRKSEGGTASVESYGATPYMYKTKHGIKADPEVIKKSLTDAIKKALSLLGFSADVWLGMHDNAEYLAENAVEFDIKNASDKAEDVVRLRAELDEKMSRVANTLEKSISQNEAVKVYGTIAREVEVHRKNAEAKGDTEHAKYLAGRLRRLNDIKNTRITELKSKEGENA